MQDNPGSPSVTSSASASLLATGPFPAPVTVGSLVVVYAWGNANINTALLTCTDNAVVPNQYTRLSGVTNAGPPVCWVAMFIGIVRSNPVSGNLSCTITATGTGTMQVCAAEFAGGTTATDRASSGNGASGIPKPAMATTVLPGCLIVSAFSDGDTGSPATVTTPADFTDVGKQTNGATLTVGEAVWRIVPDVGVYNPSWDSGAVPWAATGAALRVTAPSCHFPGMF